MLALDILGPVALRRDGAPQWLSVKKTLALLDLLCRSGPQPRTRVVAMLWPRLDESSGRRNLRRELARLREAGVEGAVLAQGDFLALSTEVACDVDAIDDFESPFEWAQFLSRALRQPGRPGRGSGGLR